MLMLYNVFDITPNNARTFMRTIVRNKAAAPLLVSSDINIQCNDD